MASTAATRDFYKGYQYLDTIGSEVVSETKNPEDKHHLGRLLLKVFKSHPEHIIQIDTNTGQSETYESFSRRTIRAALGLRSRGLRRGDVVVIMGPNHLHITVPLVACQYDGIIADPLDRTWKEAELTAAFNTAKPKLIFCQQAYTPTLKKVIETTGIGCSIVTFDTNGGEFETYDNFLAEASDESVQSFTPAKFDPVETIALLYSTSGSTGLSKSAAVTHKALVIQVATIWYAFTQFPRPLDKVLMLSPMQWASGSLVTISSCLMVVTRVQTSVEAVTVKLTMEIIDKFKPFMAVITPSVVSMILHHPDVDKYDLTSLKYALIGGMASHPGILEQFVKKTKGNVYNAFGCSESGGGMFNFLDAKPGSLGPPLPFVDVKLVDSKTGQEVGINENGELLFKAEFTFKEYYKRPAETKAAFSEDGYVKSGDIFYRDADNHFYFVDREKCILKYNSHQISPTELEGLIKTLPGVTDAAVTGVPHPDCGDVVVAFVVPTSPDPVSEDDVTGVVAKNLAPSKRLRGGVRFVESLPMTSTAKIDRSALKQLAIRTFDLVDSKTGQEVGINENGELLFKAEFTFKEYYKRPAETKAAFSEDGYVKSGDIFYRDADNHFYFVDREKCILKYNSHQISPTELEGLIKTLPGVTDAAVTGVPHPDCGDVVVAFVVPTSPDPVSEDDVTGVVAKNLAPSKRLRGGVRFVESLPMTSTAKIDRSALKQLAIRTFDVSKIVLD